MKSLFYILLVLLSCQHRHSSMQVVVVRALEIVDQQQQQPTNVNVNVNEDERLLQQQTNNNNNNVCLQSSTTSTTSSSTKVINQVLSYLDTHKAQIESSIFIHFLSSPVINYGIKFSGKGGCIAKWLVLLLCTQLPWVQFLAFPKFFLEIVLMKKMSILQRFIEGTAA